MRQLLWLFVFLLSLGFNSLAINKYVATAANGGNDANVGSQVSPYLTFGKAASVATAIGDSIIFSAGTFTQITQVIVAPGVQIKGVGSWVGGTRINLSFSVAGSGGYNSAAIQLVTASVNNNIGNQSITGIWFDGTNFTCLNGILVRCRSNVIFDRCKFTNFGIVAIAFNGKTANSTGLPPAIFSQDNQVTNCTFLDCSDRITQAANSISAGSISYSGQRNLLFQFDTLRNINKPQGHNGNNFGGVQGNNIGTKWLDCIFEKPADEGSTFNFNIESWYDQGGTIYARNTYTGGGNCIDVGYGGANKGDSTYSWYIHHNLFTNPSLLTANPGVQPVLSIAIQFESSTNIGLRPQNATIGDAIIEYNTCRNVGTFLQIGLSNYSLDFLDNISVNHNDLGSMGYANNAYSGVFMIGLNSGVRINNISIDNNTIVGTHTGTIATGTATVGAPKANLILEADVDVIQNINFRNNIALFASGYGYLLFRGNKSVNTLKSQNNITFRNAFSDNPNFILTPFNAGSFIVGNVYRIASVGTTVWTSIGAANNNAGTVFTATGAGSGNGIATTEIPPINFTNTGNIKANPIFVNDVTPDYHLASGSPGISGGLTPPGYTVSGYYIGAYPPGTITPTITWNNPAAITYGTALSGTQLNATSGGVPGAFVYTPAAGTILNAGVGQTLNVVFTPTDQTTYSVVSKSVTITVNQATAALTYSNLTQTYTGNPLQPTVTTNPAGLTVVNTTFNGLGSIPTNAGAYTVVSGLSNPNYTASTITNTFTINKATAVINVTNLSQTYDGTQKPVTFSSVPNVSGLSATYDGSPTPSINAGNHTVVVSLSNPNYQATPVTVTLVIAKANPTINTWTPASPITYGTAIGASQNNLTSPVAGVFTYSPANGFIPSAGTLALNATFTPTDGTNYNTITGISSSITVSKAVATINVSNTTQSFDGSPKPITATTTPAGLEGSLTILYSGSPTAPSAVGSYPFSVTMSDVNYTATPVNGTLVISSNAASIFITNLNQVYANGSPLPVTITTSPSGLPHSVTYNGSASVPTVTGTYTVIATITSGGTGADTQTLVIAKANPVINWASPSDITYGTSLTGIELNANSTVAGTFTYTPVMGTIPNAGTQNLSVVFTPTDGANYNTVTKIVSINVLQAQAALTLSGLVQTFNGNPHPVVVSTSPAALSGVTILYNGSSVPPTNAGSYPISVTLTNSNYTATPISGTLTVFKALPILSWAIPAQIQYGTALSSLQLNATANIAGTFTYAPTFGTVLNPGTTSLVATFHPSDLINYTNNTTITVPLSVSGSQFLMWYLTRGGTIYADE